MKESNTWSTDEKKSFVKRVEIPSFSDFCWNLWFGFWGISVVVVVIALLYGAYLALIEVSGFAMVFFGIIMDHKIITLYISSTIFLVVVVLQVMGYYVRRGW